MVKLRKYFTAFFLVVILFLCHLGYDKDIVIAEEVFVRVPLNGTKRIEKSLSFIRPVLVSPLPIRRKFYSKEASSSLPNATEHLGPILVFNTMDLATDIAVTPLGAQLEFKSTKLSKEMNAMLELFKTTNTALTYYLWATLKTSWVSCLVHGLNYEEAGKISEKEGNGALLEYIREKKKSFGITEGVIISRAEIIGPHRLYLEAETDKRRFSMIIGYPTKNCRVSFKTQDGQEAALDLCEGYGNVFSPDVELAEQADQSVIKFGNHIDVLDTQRLIQRAHEDGNFVIMDAMLWAPPSALTEKNYYLFHHTVIESPDSDKDIMVQRRGVILHLNDGRRVLVYLRNDSQDQLSPDLNNHSDYWHKYFSHYMKQFIETLDIDGFRIDLALELHRWNGENVEDYDFLKHILFEAVESTLREKRKRIYFALEVYKQFHRDIIRNWNRELVEQLKQKDLLGENDEYNPFNTYFPNIFQNLHEGNINALTGALNWIFEGGKDAEIGYLTNFDEFALATYMRDERLRNGYMLLLVLMSKAGYNTLIYSRDLIREGDLRPVVGGHRNDSTGEYDTHKFLSGAELLEKFKYQTEAEWLKTSFGYAMFNLPITIESVKISGHKIIFSAHENLRIEIDLNTGEIIWTSIATGKRLPDHHVVETFL